MCIVHTTPFSQSLYDPHNNTIARAYEILLAKYVEGFIQFSDFPLKFLKGRYGNWKNRPLIKALQQPSDNVCRPAGRT